MPYIDASHYQHELDRQALNTLKSTPGFMVFLEAFLNAYDERAVSISAKSSYIEITSDQLSEYYEMVPPVCEKLGIEVPALYLADDDSVKAYTMNEEAPIIVVSAGAVQNCSKDTTSVLLARECGHIASHHVLYQTMGSLIVDGAAAVLPGASGFLNVDLQAAFLSWRRAGEYTADRAAAIALGSADVVINALIELSGGWNSLGLNIDRELFIQQVAENEPLIREGAKNKVFEVLFHSLKGERLFYAYRALDLKRWCQLGEFENMQRFLRGEEVVNLAPASAEQANSDEEAHPSAVKEGHFFCINCGASLKEGQRFCSSCGYKCE